MSKNVKWFSDPCPMCGGKLNSWDKRVSRALGYKIPICEACIGKEYGKTVEEIRGVMKDYFGMLPCRGL